MRKLKIILLIAMLNICFCATALAANLALIKATGEMPAEAPYAEDQACIMARGNAVAVVAAKFKVPDDSELMRKLKYDYAMIITDTPSIIEKKTIDGVVKVSCEIAVDIDIMQLVIDKEERNQRTFIEEELLRN